MRGIVIRRDSQRRAFLKSDDKFLLLLKKHNIGISIRDNGELDIDYEYTHQDGDVTLFEVDVPETVYIALCQRAQLTSSLITFFQEVTIDLATGGS